MYDSTSYVILADFGVALDLFFHIQNTLIMLMALFHLFFNYLVNYSIDLHKTSDNIFLINRCYKNTF